MKIKIAIIDDEQLIVEGIELLLANEKGLHVCLVSNNGNDFMENLGKLSADEFPDLALIDIQMKPMNGFELVEILKIKYPELKIIILSSYYKSSVLGYMVKLGISAFLSKGSDRKKFIEVINAVYENGYFFTTEDHQLLLAYMNSNLKKKILFNFENELSDREKEVVRLICEQHTNAEIAEKLFLSPRTVESHRQRILEKVGAKNTVGIVVYAIVNDIYSLPLKF
ncbi:response regulator transcription factor [Empedobacter brevis]|uniref:response regulator transcription factor n=1 Tax=Empedobacter brevis TaxID=247 RepID=UPI00123CFF41|nr:response regulator transcription factor [Empedobacter brevis]QES93776.1 response regulator transcription factor [Empedobacter brevis]